MRRQTGRLPLWQREYTRNSCVNKPLAQLEKARPQFLSCQRRSVTMAPCAADSSSTIAPTVILLAACTRAPVPRQYDLTGQVLTVSPDGRELVVRHDDVRGFMPAMTMPFRLKDPALARDRRPGDLIRATVDGDRRGVVADRHREDRLGASPGRRRVEPRPPSSWQRPATWCPTRRWSTRTAGRSASRRSGGRPSSSRSSTPAARSRTSARGWTPTSPPSRRRWLTVGCGGPVRLLSVSFDPDFDTPAVLKAHAANVGADPRVWTFATAPSGPGGGVGRPARTERHPGREGPLRPDPQPPDRRDRSAGPARDGPGREPLDGGRGDCGALRRGGGAVR